MSRKYTIIIIVAALAFGMFLSTMVIVPWQIKKQGANWIAKNTTRTLTIEDASFNPFTLTIEIDGANLTEPDSNQPFITIKQLILSGSIKSLFKQAVILDRVEIDAPFINIELYGKQAFNFSDFIAADEDNHEPKVAKKPLHFSLNNISLKNGSIDFSDQTSKKKSLHKIREISLQLPFIGNIPYLANSYVEPFLRMLLNDAEIKINGKLKPFHNSLKTDLFLSLKDVDLAFYAFHSPVPLPLNVKHGLLDCEIDLSYIISKAEKPKLILGGDLTLTKVNLQELDGDSLFEMSRLYLDLDWGDVFAQDFNLAAIEIDDPQVYVNRDNSGKWNFQQLLPPSQTKDKATTTGTGDSPKIKVTKLTLTNGLINFADNFIPGTFAEQIHIPKVELNNLSTLYQQQTTARVEIQTERDFNLSINGDFSLNPTTAAITLAATSFPLRPYYPYIEWLLKAPIEGSIDLSGQISYTQDGNISINQGQLQLTELQVPFADNEQFTLANLTIADSSFNLLQKDLKLGDISLSTGEITANRLADGSLSPLNLIKTQPVVEKTSPKEAAEPWDISANSVKLQNFDLLLTDSSFTKKPQIEIADFNFRIANIKYPDSANSPFELDLKVGKKGSIAVDGTVAHTPLQLKGQTQIKSFPLTFFNNFVPEGINTSLKDGNLSSILAFGIKQQPDKLTGNYSGDLEISNFELRDPIGDGELLLWDKLSVNGISGNLAPTTLHVKEVVLSDYLANIKITAEGRINLARLTTPGEEPIKRQRIIPLAKRSAADIKIDMVTLQDGTVSFIDRHLMQLFAVTMYELGGDITGLASAKEMQADVDLHGQLENNSPLTIKGKINPLSSELFTDITISFMDIDLVQMSPYAGTFLGQNIDKGKLNLDLNYHIENQKITATNKVMIDQFTFGDSVDSDEATSMPVSLAVALLKDSNDEIHLDLPVSGDLNDPSFSISSTILTILKNILVKAATSPFALLGSMMGGDEGFTGVHFASGEATIDSKQLENLSNLATKLAKRPSLTLEISGFVDKDNDLDGYRQVQLKQLLIDAKWSTLGADERTNKSRKDITIDPEEYHRFLLSVYKNEDFPRPRNFVGMLKKQPDDEMEALLLNNIKADEEELQALAMARAIATREALIEASKDIKPRLFLQKPDIYQPPETGIASRVEFNIKSK